MNITTYDSNGLVLETESIDSKVPECIERFDNQQSFLSITDEEHRLINSRSHSLRRTLLIRRLTAAVLQDYRNFLKVSSIEAEDLDVNVEMLLQEGASDPYIKTGDKVLSSILRIYGNLSRYTYVRINKGDDFFSQETFAKEEFLIYINKVEHQHEDKQGNISVSSWINVLFHHALKSAMTVKLRHNDVDVETRFYISLQNLINKYYYALRNMERVASWMPDELKHHMYVLSAFVKNSDKRNLYTFDEQHFFIKVINALYLSKEKNRSELYAMMKMVLDYNPTIKRQGQVVYWCESTQKEPQKKEYPIKLLGYKKRPTFIFTINDDEIYAMRMPSSDRSLIDRLHEELCFIYSQYVKINGKKWEDNVLTDANTYFVRQRPYQENWMTYYNHVVEKYRNEDQIATDQYKPQRCFFFLLCDYIHPAPNQQLTFSNDVIAGLIELLIHHIGNDYDDQGGLYECMYKMNYIKKKMAHGNPTEEAISRAIRYIECLFTDECKHVNFLFRDTMRDLLLQLFSLKNVKERITIEAPGNFHAGFNLKLVYNILGLLKNKNIITTGAEKLDKYINSYAIKMKIIKEPPTERKSYISGYKSDNRSEIAEFIDDLTVVVDNYIKNTLQKDM